jgi:polysaccharide pyruvyl transferase WcaK-like protein
VILVQHAYSRANAGDGLLVDLTLARLRRLFGDVPVRVRAADARSFADLDDVIQVPAASSHYLERLGGCASEALRLAAQAVGWRHTRAGPPAGVDLLVGVGGGYLRAVTAAQRLKFSLVHLPQLLVAAAAGARSVYLPQSIGPFRAPLANVVRDALGRVGVVCVRDDRSRDQVHSANVHRIPDLAVLAVAERAAAPAARAPNRFVVCARDLGFRGADRARYVALLRTLLARLPDATLAIQSRGRGNDDEAFCRRELGATGVLPGMLAAIEERPDCAVVSVRLHGALQAVMRGVPALHLSYERKGFGAFADLGLSHLVWNARTADPANVLAAADLIRNRPPDYWDRIAARRDALRAASSRLDALIVAARSGARKPS